MSSYASTTRYITMKQKGDPAIGVVCTMPKISYSRAEAYETSIILQMNEGGVIVTPSACTVQIAYSSEPNTIINVNPNLKYNGMKIAPPMIGNRTSIHVTIDRGADFKGQIRLSLTYKGETFYQSVDVSYYNVAATADYGLKELVYNPNEATKIVQFEAALIIDGVRETDVAVNANWQTSDGIAGVTYSATSFYNGISFCMPETGKLQFIIQQGATLEGSLMVNLIKGDVTRTITIPIVRLKPDDSFSLLCSSYGVTYNPARASSQSISVQLKVGETFVTPTFSSARLIGANNVVQQTFTALGGTKNGMTVGFGQNESTHTIDLAFAVGASVFGTLVATYSYNGTSYTAQITLTKVSDGAQGLRGIKGAYIRGPRNFNDVVMAFEDSQTEKFYCGANDEPFIDIVLYQGKYYVCKQTHVVSLSAPPTQANNAYWEQFSELPFVATQLLLADRAKIENLIADGIAMVEIDPETNQPKEIFTVTKDAEGHSIVYASQGLFENISVKGDIKCNTQTYVLPEWSEADKKLTQSYVSQPTLVVETTPEGGCMIIPTGWCHHRINLKNVNAGEARKIVIVNQCLPCRSTNANASDRKVILKPAEQNVFIFNNLEESSNGSYIRYGSEGMTLNFGVYTLIGYRADIYVSGNLQSQTIWSMWRCDTPITYNIPTFNPSGFTINQGNSLPMYNNNIQNI